MSDGAFNQVRSPEEAVALLTQRIETVGAESIGLAAAAGRVLAEPVRADRPSPAMDYSAMDGFALRASEAASVMRVTGRVFIGREPPALPSGSVALTIVTGAPIPPGADCVIMREHVVESDGRIVIEPSRLPELRPGLNIRCAGENAAAGQEILRAGQLITPAVAGALAAVGLAAPRVHRRIRVAVLSTGDELVDVTGTPTRWQIRDSNGPALRAFLSVLPWVEVLPAPGRLPDEPATMKREIERTLSEADAVLLTGGVSMGDFDLVPRVLGEVGATRLFHKVPQRPGRPVLGALGPDGQPILGLPGNPVSVLVTARRIALPALRKRAGFADPSPACSLTRLSNPDGRSIGLWWLRLVRRNPVAAGEAELIDLRGSGDLIAAGACDGFVEIQPEGSGPGPWPFFGWSA